MKYKLSEVVDLIGGGTPKTSVSEYWGGNIPWLSVKDFNNDYRYVYETEKTITELGLQNSSTKLLQKGDVIISARGTVGEIATIPFPMAFNQSCYGLRAKQNIVTDDFLYYLIKYNIFALKKNTHGSVFDTITRDTFNGIEVDIPDIEQQKKISSILVDLDNKIELNGKINKNLELQAATLFNGWLANCEEDITIGELSQNILDYTPNNNAKVKLLNSSDITEGVFPTTPFVVNENLKGHFKKRFAKGDILYSEIRPRNHHYGYVLFDANDFIASTRLMVIRNNPQMISSVLLYQYLLLPSVDSEFTLKTESRSGTFPQGNYADMASISVPYSYKDTQLEIENILLAIRNSIYNNQVENEKLTTLRDTILPKLMSGEIDVSDIDI